MVVFLSDNDTAVTGESNINWLEDVSSLAYVRQAFAITHRRQSKIPYRGVRVVGYTQLSKNAKRYDKDIYNRPEFLRRVFYLTDWDRDSQPRGTYRSHWPMEAVDPRSVIPGFASQAPSDWGVEQVELNSIESGVRALSERIAFNIAEDPTELFNLHIGWRDMERTMAEVFEGIGFKVTLTPASKDGGKDIVACCYIQGKKKTYYIEIKHWRTKRVDRKHVTNFIEVVMADDTVHGLILSSSGYKKPDYSILTEVEIKKIRLGDQEMITSFCKTYVTTKNGIRFPTEALPKIIFAGLNKPS